jgi:hypothetical protein
MLIDPKGCLSAAEYYAPHPSSLDIPLVTDADANREKRYLDAAAFS